MKLKNKKVLVYGLGESGRSVIKILQEKCAYVSFYDDDPKFMEYVGYVRNPQEKQFDFVVVSPGVKCLGNSLLDSFAQRNIPVISELDFAYSLSKGKLIGITGTNGKTTVSMLVHRILKTAGFETFLCGNIGLPFSSVCEKTTKNTITVCEVSNFQLEASQIFAPDVACILNIKPDHLDRHGQMEEYIRVKTKIAQRQKRGDALILNADDDIAGKLKIKKKQQFFTKKCAKRGVFVKNGQIFVCRKKILSVSEIPLRGEKNLENVLASVAICSNFQVKSEYIQKAVLSFTPASHRMEIVGSYGGVTFVDDSKATNVASTVACVEAFSDKPIVLLVGGKGKLAGYGDLFGKGFALKQVLCFGEEAENIAKSAKNHDYLCEVFQKFDDATRYAIENAQSGDYVLLSPACSSFDEFSNYAERGERFQSLVLGSVR